MNRDILQDIIDDFSPDKFAILFRDKNRSFAPRQESFSQYNDKSFTDGLKLGEIAFSSSEKLFVCTFKANQPLSERSGKKAQYEIGKRILKDIQGDAGIFVFYDKDGNFRFSFIYPETIGNRRQWSSFRRFTYFVSQEFTNKTFLQRIGGGDFTSLEKIKDAFSVEKVTKDFYEKLADWYFWAVQNVEFPKDAEKEENGRNIAVIRLITRLIFIWFMKERKLINRDIFDFQKIKILLKDITSESTAYYKAILQNLFFATLNTKINKRKFRFQITGWKNSSYMDHSVYRYENYFKNKKDMLVIFKDIPFLNGGLFDCLDRIISDKEKNIEVRIDGFTDKESGLKIPNYLFFSEEKEADLNSAYGTINKKYKVRGIINILSSYNFTIDENDLYDQEVALDPELLGRVFENLLASFNPETATTARKSTGSYYTPREIVDYMVTESLKQYFKTHLVNTPNLEEKLEKLFSRDNQENPFEKNESDKVVGLIENLRVIDPAVGSGAFPMGILNKLTFVLSKIDPRNLLWKKAQINAIRQSVPDPLVKQKLIDQVEKQFQEKDTNYGRKLYLIQKCIYGVDIQQIAVEIAKLRFFISLLVDEKIDKNIENWGIEPLPNLDFKLMQGNSLIEMFSPNLLAQTTDHQRNKLINDLKDLKERFFTIADSREKQRRKAEINESVRNIVNYDDEKRRQNIEDAIRSKKSQVEFNFKEKDLDFASVGNKEIQKLSENLNMLESVAKKKITSHFEWHLNFNEVFESGGFDIVIANPPYLKERDHKEIFQTINESDFGKLYHQGKMDFWFYFLHKAIDIVKSDGVISYITSRYWLNSSGAKKLIQRVATELSFVNFIDIGKLKVFNEVAGQHMVAVYIKNKNHDNFTYKKLKNDISNIGSNIDTENVKVKTLSNKKVFTNNEIVLENDNIKIEEVISLGEITDISQGVVEATDKISQKQIEKSKRKDVSAGDGVFVITKSELSNLKISSNEKLIVKKYLDPNNISSYQINWNNKYLIYSDKEAKNLIKNDHNYANIKKHLDNFKEFITSSNKPYGLHRPRELKYFKEPKIIFKNMFVNNEFTYDENGYFVGFSFSLIINKNKNYDLKYILAILNSKFALNWFYKYGKRRGAGVDIGVEKLRQFPIKIISADQQKPFIEIVDNILSCTKAGDYLENSSQQTKVKEYERQIDQMVYALYGLTKEDIEVTEKQT